MLECWRSLSEVLACYGGNKKVPIKGRSVHGFYRAVQALLVIHALATFLWHEKYQTKDNGVSMVKTELKTSLPITDASLSDDDKKIGYLEGSTSIPNLWNSTQDHQSPYICYTDGGCKDPSLLDDAHVDLKKTKEKMMNAKVQVKVQVWFPKFNVRRQNVDKRVCNEENDHSGCAIFKLGDIIEASESDSSPESAIASSTYGILVNWDCNLDEGEENCKPEYSFRKLEGVNDNNSASSHKINISHSNLSVDNNENTLQQNNGVDFLVIVTAKAGKFAVETLFVQLGVLIVRIYAFKWFCHFLVLFWGIGNEVDSKAFDAHDEDEFDE